MNEREIGHMQIANERIRVIEPTKGSLSPAWPFLPESYREFMENAIFWQALTEDGNSIAIAGFLQDQPTNEHVLFWVEVDSTWRGNGLGALMIRLATDQAIHYRKRSIVTKVPAVNLQAIHLLEDQEFEKLRGIEDTVDLVVLRKSLKWV